VLLTEPWRAVIGTPSRLASRISCRLLLLTIGEFSGGPGIIRGLGSWNSCFLGFDELGNGITSVLSEGKTAGRESPAFRVRFAVSMSWGANLRGGLGEVISESA
jgi:hypothetical protein